MTYLHFATEIWHQRDAAEEFHLTQFPMLVGLIVDFEIAPGEFE